MFFFIRIDAISGTKMEYDANEPVGILNTPQLDEYYLEESLLTMSARFQAVICSRGKWIAYKMVIKYVKHDMYIV